MPSPTFPAPTRRAFSNNALTQRFTGMTFAALCQYVLLSVASLSSYNLFFFGVRPYTAVAWLRVARSPFATGVHQLLVEAARVDQSVPGSYASRLDGVLPTRRAAAAGAASGANSGTARGGRSTPTPAAGDADARRDAAAATSGAAGDASGDAAVIASLRARTAVRPMLLGVLTVIIGRIGGFAVSAAAVCVWMPSLYMIVRKGAWYLLDTAAAPGDNGGAGAGERGEKHAPAARPGHRATVSRGFEALLQVRYAILLLCEVGFQLSATAETAYWWNACATILQVSGSTLNIMVITLQCLLADEEARVVDAAQAEMAYKAEAEASIHEARRRFMRYCFHETRVPLNSMLLAVEELAAHPAIAATPELAESVAIMQSSGSACVGVMNSVLTLGAIEADGFVLDMRPCDLGAVLQTVEQQVRPLARAVATEIVLQLDPALSEWRLVCDAERLRQVVLNFASNAVRWTPRDGSGRVIVRSQLESMVAAAAAAVGDGMLPAPDASPSQPPLMATVRIEVIDNGCGIAEGEAAKLFQPYAQVQSGDHAKKILGTGLGLAIAKEIVGRHGGAPGVSSEVGRGSNFFFVVRLPVAGRAAILEPWQALVSRPAEASARHAAAAASTVDTYRGAPAALPALSAEAAQTAVAAAAESGEVAAPHDSPPVASILSTPPRRPAPAATHAVAGGSSHDEAALPEAVAAAAETVSPPPKPPAARATRAPGGSPLESAPQRLPALLELPASAGDGGCGATSDAASARTAAGVPSGGSPGAPSALGQSPDVADTATAVPSAALTALSWPRRCLFVDDDRPSRMLLARMVSRHYGLAVADHAGNGQEAVAAVAAHGLGYYDVVFLDQSMPVMDGPAAARAIRAMAVTAGAAGGDGSVSGAAAPAGPLLLGVTGDALLEDQAAFQACGLAAVVTKPVAMKRLIAVVDEHAPGGPSE
jgi:signal transduction histidine kinase